MRICQALDTDGSGSISLDEFLAYFGAVTDQDAERGKADEDKSLQDDIWPEWVIKENKLARA